MCKQAIISSALAFVLPVFLSAQTAPDTYLVSFTDKLNTPYSISAPEQFLSARSIARRQAQGIAIEASDLPVDPGYIAGVLATGDVQLINRSKWFNAITVRTTDEAALDAIALLPFVSQVRGTRRLMSGVPAEDKFTLLADAPLVARGGQPEDYGDSWTQISMLNGHLLHAMEAKGQGMLIGVLDSGFDRTDELAAFDDLRARDGIVLTRDMVNHDGDVYDDHWHGRSVLSFMAGILPGYLQGTAPLADYALVRTEEVAFEFIIEEDNWVAGAELLDSLGCDVLNTSLGYTTFDDSLQNHAYADMDGATARISIAAGMAAQKGMIPVQSAGNSGSSDWHFISAAADAIDILAVGAVGGDENHAPFSSFGPSADGRVKPDVMAMGWGAIGLRFEGDSVASISGTSFAAPILAGLVACLWQLHPERQAHDIMDAVRRSAHLWTNPNDSMGYGIPDFMLAHDYLTQTAGLPDPIEDHVFVFPNPVADHLSVQLPRAWDDGALRMELFDLAGRVVLSEQRLTPGKTIRISGLSAHPAGLYLLKVSNGYRSATARVVRQ
ncbi:MAG: S8 family peptidase [Flavobacteriales bacterium]|nr:S8 family peptidase [Flavobacteriales bacterium]